MTIKTEGFKKLRGSASLLHVDIVHSLLTVDSLNLLIMVTDRLTDNTETHGISLKAVPNSGKSELDILERNKA